MTFNVGITWTRMLDGKENGCSLWIFSLRNVASMLGEAGVISQVEINGGESFQERVREPLGCYSLQTSSTTHSNVCL